MVGASGLALTGCRLRTPTDERPAPTPPPVDPDVALRDQARAAIAAQATLLTTVMKQRPGSVGRLRPWEALHHTHLEALPGGTSTPSPAAPSVPPEAKVADVLAGERALQAQLASYAQRAESGGFARLLASMSAAIGQRVAS